MTTSTIEAARTNGTAVSAAPAESIAHVRKLARMVTRIAERICDSTG